MKIGVVIVIILFLIINPVYFLSAINPPEDFERAKLLEGQEIIHIKTSKKGEIQKVGWKWISIPSHDKHLVFEIKIEGEKKKKLEYKSLSKFLNEYKIILKDNSVGKKDSRISENEDIVSLEKAKELVGSVVIYNGDDKFFKKDTEFLIMDVRTSYCPPDYKVLCLVFRFKNYITNTLVEYPYKSLEEFKSNWNIIKTAEELKMGKMKEQLDQERKRQEENQKEEKFFHLIAVGNKKILHLQEKMKECIVEDIEENIFPRCEERFQEILKALTHFLREISEELKRLQDIGKLNEVTIEKFASSQLSTINRILKEWYEKDDESALIYAICGQPDNIAKSGIELEYTYKIPGFRILFKKIKGIYKVKSIIPISIYEKKLEEIDREWKKLDNEIKEIIKEMIKEKR